MNSPSLQLLAEEVVRSTGIVLDQGGRMHALEQFVERRMASLNLPSRSAYLSSLRHAEQPEMARLINAVTVGYTWFFRDPEQLDLAIALLSGLDPQKPAQIWVAGCATGEDVYSLAMLAREAGVRAEIVGSDINSDSLIGARTAHYGASSLSRFPERFRQLLRPVTRDTWQPVAELRERVRFLYHNLSDAPLAPATGTGWDLILCRNVLIYFSPSHAVDVVRRLGHALGPERYLLLGASDGITETPAPLRAVRRGERGVLQRSSGAPKTSRPARNARTTGNALRLAFPPPLAALPAPRIVEPPPALRAAEAPAAPHVIDLPIEPTPPHRHGSRLLQAEAQRALGQGRFREAAGLYQKALEGNGTDAHIHLWVGVSLHMCGDSEAAAHALRSALFLDPLLWPAAFYLALSLERLDRPDQARREYRRVLAAAQADFTRQEGNLIWGDLETWKRDILAIAEARSRSTRRQHDAG